MVAPPDRGAGLRISYSAASGNKRSDRGAKGLTRRSIIGSNDSRVDRERADFDAGRVTR